MTPRQFDDTRISQIESLAELKKFACPKTAYMKEWYMKCIDCASFKTCKAGQQAVKLMELSTAPKKNDIPPMPNQKLDLKAYVEWVFKYTDPVKTLMETNTAVKPQSVYQRVHMWKKNYPDLEEKYHMLEKFRFLWGNPYAQMKIPDILKMMYPEEKEPEKKAEEIVSDVKDALRKTIVEGISSQITEKQKNELPLRMSGESFADFRKRKDQMKAAKNEPESDEVNLDDFLKSEAKDMTEKQTFEYDANGIKVVSVPEEEMAAMAEVSAQTDNLDILIGKLRKNIAEYKQKIQEAEEKISAILTVKKIMEEGV